MLDYAAQIPPDDRWAIVAYIRALQLAQHATLADVPASARPALETRARRTGAACRSTPTTGAAPRRGPDRARREGHAVSIDAADDPRVAAEAATLSRRVFVVGVVASSARSRYGSAHPDQFFHSYLLAFMFWIGLALGCARDPACCST